MKFAGTYEMGRVDIIFAGSKYSMILSTFLIIADNVYFKASKSIYRMC